MFLAASFIIGKVWKQPRYSSTDEWIKKMWYIHTHTHTHTHTKRQNRVAVGERGVLWDYMISCVKLLKPVKNYRI